MDWALLVSEVQNEARQWIKAGAKGLASLLG
jgi:hypothetical protein